MRTGPLLAAMFGSAVCTLLLHLATVPDSVVSAIGHGAIAAFVYISGIKEGQQ